jgi:hypothetical protein
MHAEFLQGSALAWRPVSGILVGVIGLISFSILELP